MKFINRKKELNYLKNNLKEGGLVVVYGRRRIGKTELLKQLKIKNKIYYLVKEQPLERTIEELNNKLIKELNETQLLDNPLNTVEKLFNYFLDKKLIFVLDEFPLLLKHKKILGNLQEFLDEKPKSTIILCGSYISAMEKIKDYSSPIYGRRMFSLKVQPLNFSHLKDFFPKAKKEELIKIYGALGGVPEYLLKFISSSGKKQRFVFENFIEKNFFSKDTYLSEEAEFLLRYELRDLSVYNSILKSIAAGYTTLGEISQKSFVEKHAIIKYIDILMGLGIVKKELPYLSKRKEKLKERGALYFVSDNYFNFYYNFVYSFKEEIGLGLVGKARNYFDKNFNAYLGFIFEEITRQFLIEKYGVSFGRQWGSYNEREKGRILTKQYEIDLLSVDDNAKELLAFEVKWKDLDYEKSRRILMELGSKVEQLPLDLKKYKIKLGIVGKNIKGKKKLIKDNFMVFDIKDF